MVLLPNSGAPGRGAGRLHCSSQATLGPRSRSARVRPRSHAVGSGSGFFLTMSTHPVGEHQERERLREISPARRAALALGERTAREGHHVLKRAERDGDAAQGLRREHGARVEDNLVARARGASALVAFELAGALRETRRDERGARA